MVEYRVNMAAYCQQDNRSGLRMLIGFNRLTGTCYTWWNFGSKLKFKYKIINIIMTIITVIVATYFSYRDIDLLVQFIKDRIDGRSNMTMVVFILTTISDIFYSVKWIYLFFFSIFRVKKIFQLLNDQDISISYHRERKIGLTLIICQISVLLTIEAIFPLTTLIVQGVDRFDLFENLIVFVTYTIVENFQATMLTLLAYQCCVIEEKLRELTENFTSLNQFTTISQQILKIQYSVKRFDLMTTQLTFFTLMVNSVNCVSNVALVYHDGLQIHDFVIGGIVECIFEIFIVCYLSNKMCFGMTKLMNKFEMLELGHPQHFIDHCLIMRIYAMRDELCLSAMNLYEINIKTFISIMSFIVTFSVIIIQTNFPG